MGAGERARKRRRGGGGRRFPAPRGAVLAAAGALAPGGGAATARGQLAGGLVWLAVGEAAYGALYLACLGRPAPLQWPAPPEARGVRLAPEEAFLLAHELGCLEVVDEKGGDSPMGSAQLWAALRTSNPRFPIVYTAFRHFLAKGWFVRSGLSYGVDYVLYRGHPETVHAEYAVSVQSLPPEGLAAAQVAAAVTTIDKGSRGGSTFADWVQVQALVRLCGQVGKQVVVFHSRISTRDDGGGGEDGGERAKGRNGESGGVAGDVGDAWAVPTCLERVEVREVLVGRWAPESGKAPEAPS